MTTTGHAGLPRIPTRRTRVGLVAGGLGAYWPQFPDLLPTLRASAERVTERMRGLDCEVVDAGFISDAQEGAVAAETLRAGRLRPHRRVPDDVHDRDDAGAGRAAQRRPGAAAQPAADRGDGPRDVRHRSVARLLRRLPAARDGQRVPPLRHRDPFGLRLPRGGRGLGEDLALGARGRRSRRAAARTARAARPPLPGHARRRHRPHPRARPVRRPHRGARDRRPAGTGREGHRRRRPTLGWRSPATCSTSTIRWSRTTCAGAPGSRSGSTGSSRTSPSTAWPTTTAASTARCTNGRAPA